MQAYLLLLLTLFLPSPTASDPLWSGVCQPDHPAAHLPFCNSQLTLNDRLNDYVQRIPVEHQIDMMSHPAKGYDPLGIPPYQWWSEGLHGPLEPCVEYKGQTKCPTSFPCPSGLGNTFNSTHFYEIGVAIGTEGKAISQLRPHDMSVGDGLTYWSPNVNLQRDPRWGRNQEAPGEDPFLTSVYARNFVSGLQNTSKNDDSDHEEPLRIAACCKHFIANSLEKWKGHTRHNFDAKLSEEDLHDYYYRPFQECAQARAAGVMCSYNSLNGIPACLHDKLLNQTLRRSWGFDGYLVTDCWALHDTIEGHKYARDQEEASAMAVAATVDVNCGDSFQHGLLKAYQNSRISKLDIQSSFRRLAKIQFRLGLFNGKKYEPERDIQLVGSHGNLAMEAALQSIVLLTNQNRTLPLNTDQKVVMIGPHVFGRQVFLSNYHGDACPSNSTKGKSFECIESPFEIFSKTSQYPVKAIMGCSVADAKINEIDKAVDLARTADAVVLMLGLNQSQEGEENDRTETFLPGLQRQLLQSVLDVAAEKTIVVLVHGGAMSLGKDAIERSGAILSASYGGLKASTALAHVLYGFYNPSGKLSSTMYPATFVDDIPLTEMGLNVGVGRTHMFYKGIPEFSFGHGLSYSTWNLSFDLGGDNSNPFVTIDSWQPSQTLAVNVTNMGPMKGVQTVLLFWQPQEDENSRIRQKLIGFQGTFMLAVGESQVLHFQLGHADFEAWDSTVGRSKVFAGAYQIIAKAASASISTLAYVSDDVVNMQVE